MGRVASTPEKSRTMTDLRGLTVWIVDTPDGVHLFADEADARAFADDYGDYRDMYSGTVE